MMRIVRRVWFLYRPIILSVTAIVGSVLGFLFVVVPVVRMSWDTRNQNKALQEEISSFRAKKNVLTALSAEDLFVVHTDLLAAIPADKSAATVFATVEGLAAQTGVALADITLTGVGSLATQSGQAKPAVHSSGARAMSFTVVLEGTSEAIRRFIEQASSVRRLLIVKSFDFTLATPSQARVDMEAYYAPPSPASAAPGAQVSALTDQEKEVIGRVNQLPLLGQTLILPPASLGPAKDDPFSP